MYSNVQRGDLEWLKRQERFTVGSNKLPHSVGYLHEKNNLINQVIVNVVATSLKLQYVKQPLNHSYLHNKRLTSHFLAILWVLTIDDNRV